MRRCRKLYIRDYEQEAEDELDNKGCRCAPSAKDKRSCNPCECDYYNMNKYYSHIEINFPINNPRISIIPTVNRYFYISENDIHLVNQEIISTNKFTNDEGNITSNFTILKPNGYVNIY